MTTTTSLASGAAAMAATTARAVHATEPVDTLVVGASIGGSMLAERLGALGHDTMLVDRHAAPISGRRFGVPPATLDLWDAAGMRGRLEAELPGLHMQQYVDWNTGHAIEHPTPPYTPEPAKAATGDAGHLLQALQGKDPRGGAIVGIDELTTKLRDMAVERGATLATETSFAGARYVHDEGLWHVTLQAKDGSQQTQRARTLAFADGGRESREFVGAEPVARPEHTYYVGSQFANTQAQVEAGTTQLAKATFPEAGHDRVFFAHTHPREAPADGRFGTIGWFEAPPEWTAAAGRKDAGALIEAHGAQLDGYVAASAPRLGLDPANARGGALVAPVYGEVVDRAVGRADQPGVFLLGDALGTGDIAGGSFGNAAQFDAVRLAPMVDAWLASSSVAGRSGIEGQWNDAALDARRAVVDFSLQRLQTSTAGAGVTAA